PRAWLARTGQSWSRRAGRATALPPSSRRGFSMPHLRISTPRSSGSARRSSPFPTPRISRPQPCPTRRGSAKQSSRAWGSVAAEVRMPRLSDSMEEGTILQWLKSPGEDVELGEELVEIETDKASMVYEADTAGTVI